MSGDDSAPRDGGATLRPVRTYVIRKGRMTRREKLNYEAFRGAWCIPFERRTLDLAEVFPNANPVVMEIGFGMGLSTAEIARERPDINYIGCEVHVPGVGRLLGEINESGLTNLYIIEHDALEALEVMFPDGSLAGFHIFFPDPWPKKRHHKRRLITRPRTDLLCAKLARGGYIYFVTDWEDYALSAREELSATPGLRNRYEGFAPREEWRPVTKFEQRALDEGRKIYELYFVKDGEEGV